VLLVMGDFNAKVCRREPSAKTAMSFAVGLYGLVTPLQNEHASRGLSALAELLLL